MNIAAELRNAVMDNFTIDKRLVSDAADAIEMLGEENAMLRELLDDVPAKLLRNEIADTVERFTDEWLRGDA